MQKHVRLVLLPKSVSTIFRLLLDGKSKSGLKLMLHLDNLRECCEETAQENTEKKITEVVCSSCWKSSDNIILVLPTDFLL